MQLTPTQKVAVSASGNVVVIAGAGTGKTRTLVERCLECLLHSDSPAELSEILVVTFTEAAAAEMRQRLRDRLQEQSDSSRESARAAQQLALFETAHIGTLHSFCLELVRRHFYLLELDPQFSVMSEEEARLLANEQLDALFAEKYSEEKSPQAEAVRELIASHGEGSDQNIRALVLRLHHYGQTTPDPEGWIAAQSKQFGDPEPVEWREWLAQALADFTREWLPRVKELAASNDLARECVALLEAGAGSSKLQTPNSRETSNSKLQVRAASFPLPSPPGEERENCLDSKREELRAILATRESCPAGKKSAWVEPLKDFYKDAQYLLSILPSLPDSDPLAEDWSWVCSRMGTLLELASEFTGRFSRAKRDLALADFHDLEQFALRLLWDHQADAPTKIAEQWRATFRHVMVDEYQDINAAQDQILRALSQDGPNGNRFLVGDLKQSIYRFRLAAPRIFQAYVRQWGASNSGRSGTVIPLNENFRSREGILDFINSVFELLMVEEVGGLAYEKDARLKFGAPDERRLLAATAQNEPRIEFHVRLKRVEKHKGNGEPPSSAEESLADLEEAAKEARLIALRLSELRAAKQQIWDDQFGAFRPVEWKDMAILLRAPSRKTEFYVREFSRLNVPLSAARGRFYESTEISDLLSLLAILDNPLQDLPVLAVLRSPIVGLSLEDLANIRQAAAGPFWTALLRWHDISKVANPKGIVSSSPGLRGTSYPGFDQAGSTNPERVSSSLPSSPSPLSENPSSTALPKVTRFLERFARWRSFTRQMSLSSCLEEILSETRYSEWLLTQSRGEERVANLQGLVNLTRKFDHFQRQGLLRFLIFIEAQRAADTEPPVSSVTDENAVRLLSIHQSKGLEFPVVVLADTGKAFNLSDLRAEIILDDLYGICPLIKPPETAKRYPSLPYWLARRRQRNEMLGEELRLLYVAMTRARDTLILTSSISASRLKRWLGSAKTPSNPIASATSVADWLGRWFSRHANVANREFSADSRHGEIEVNGRSLAFWTIHDDDVLTTPPLSENSAKAELPPLFLTDPAQLAELEKKLSWKYPFPSATRQTAKSSVSLLRREAALEEDETAQYFDFQPPAARIRLAKAADAGTATHSFLQSVSLDSTGSATQLRGEATRLVKQKILTAETAALVNLEHIARFWQSPLGKTIQSQSGHVHRELAFTAKVHLNELASILGTEHARDAVDDFVIIQGIADMVLLLPQSIQIIDFKTDNVSGKALAERAKQYGPQLKLYALALSRIYKRPVSGCWLYFLAAGVEVGV